MIATDYCKKVFDGTHDSPKPVENGRLLITSKHIANRSLDISSAYLISEEDFENVNKRSQVHQWDILFSMIGTVGNVYIETSEKIDYAIKNMGVFSCQNKEKAYWLYYYLQSPCFDKNMGVFSCQNKEKAYWLYYYLQSPLVQAKIDALMAGAVQKFVPLGFLRDLDIPEYTENSKKVVQVLSALDDKIALNKKMNQKLEAMAKRLYDYWFVQYDFPDKNGHPYKTTGGPMTYNEVLKREIPVGWEVVDINELCQVVDCLHSKKPDFCYEDENSYLLALENITKEGYIDLSDKYYISKKDFAEWTSRICVKENDFLFTNAGRAGDMGMVPEGVLCAIGRNITAVRPEKINPWYLRCFFKSLYMQEQILNNLDQGSFFMSFNVRSIKKLQVLMPSEPLMKKFISFVEPHLKRIEKNNKEISRLTKLRDKLLPLLMNGQVEVD